MFDTALQYVDHTLENLAPKANKDAVATKLRAEIQRDIESKIGELKQQYVGKVEDIGL